MLVEAKYESGVFKSLKTQKNDTDLQWKKIYDQFWTGGKDVREPGALENMIGKKWSGCDKN